MVQSPMQLLSIAVANCWLQLNCRKRVQPAAASDVVVVVIGIPGSERGRYHMIEPFRNLAISAVHYPNGMTLEEAEAFVELHHG
jgi:hypothetical protein